MISSRPSMLSPPQGPGWVYVLTNPAIPGCVKIGGTGRTATHRARELVREYGTGDAFTIARRHAVADWFAVEQTAHRMLSDRRVPRSELFTVTPREASCVIRAAAAAYARPWGLTAWLRRRALGPRSSLAPAPYSRRRRAASNGLPAVLLLAAIVAGVALVKPAPASWWPTSVVRSVLLLERL